MNPEFFNVQPVEAALQLLFRHWTPQPHAITLDPRQALGRILAEAVHSPIALPTFPRSTVDGYAVRAADTFGASQSLPAYLKIAGSVRMGEAARQALPTHHAIEIHTGGMLPPDADGVVMVEDTQRVNETEIEVLKPVAPGENVIQMGEDVAQGAEILPAGKRLRPQDIGGLLAVGVLSIHVMQAPRVGILSSGDELVPPDEMPASGQIRDINAYTLAALVEQAGGEPVLLGISRDTLSDYDHMAQAGFGQTDMLIMTAGSSVSTRDYTRQVINSLGQPGVLQHGLAVKPGKPTLIGLCDQKPVIGLPGNPVSALLVAQQIVVPIIKQLLGATPAPPTYHYATLTSNLASTSGREDTVPVKLIEQDEGWLAEPVFGKSNLIFTLIHADGYIHIPLNSNGIKAGAEVQVRMFE